MKKLMFMLAAVAVAACTQAASVSWTCTNVKDGTGSAISGIAYFVNAATLSQETLAGYTKASDFTTALSGMYSWTPATAGKYTEADGVANATLGLADATTATPEALYRFALAGVPVLPGPVRAYGEVKDDDLSSFFITQMSSLAIIGLRRRMDERSGGKLPVMVETPSVGLVVPWVMPDGALRSVAFVNARIDVQKSLRIRLRGVPADVKSATWRAFHEKPLSVPVKRQGTDVVATLPSLSAWNCGWLSF